MANSITITLSVVDAVLLHNILAEITGNNRVGELEDGDYAVVESVKNTIRNAMNFSTQT